MLQNMLTRIFRAVADMRRDRVLRTYNYADDSRHYDSYSTAALIAALDPERCVRVADVMLIYKSVKKRSDFRLSDEDYNAHLPGFLRAVERAVKTKTIDAWLMPDEDMPGDARVRVGDLIALSGALALPDGSDPSLKATEEQVTVIDPDFGDSRLGLFRQRLYDALPLRTPSAEVRYNLVPAEHPLNIYRPLVLSIGMAAVYMDQTDAIANAPIPTYADTATDRTGRLERQSRHRTVRSYRGVRMDHD